MVHATVTLGKNRSGVMVHATVTLGNNRSE